MSVESEEDALAVNREQREGGREGQRARKARMRRGTWERHNEEKERQMRGIINLAQLTDTPAIPWRKGVQIDLSLLPFQGARDGDGEKRKGGKGGQQER